MAGPSQSPSDLDPSIPQAISDVTMRALAPAAERYSSAAEFADALEDATEAVGIHPGSPRAVGRFVGQALQAAGLLPLPETLGGAGAPPAHYKPAPHASGTPLPSRPSGMSAGKQQPRDPACGCAGRRRGGDGCSRRIERRRLAARAPLPVAGTGSGSIVQPVATPPRRGTAVGIGAMIGGGIFMVVLAGVVTWVAVTRNNAETRRRRPRPKRADRRRALCRAAAPGDRGAERRTRRPPPPRSAVPVDSLPSATPAETAQADRRSAR